MSKNGAKGTKLAKAALARINNITSGTTGTIDQRVSPMAQSLGITFDGNNNVLDNGTNDDILLINAKIDAIAALFKITFDASGSIVAEEYTTHTHNYGISEVTEGIN